MYVQSINMPLIPSSIVNNPPNISNNPMLEKIELIKQNYNPNAQSYVKQFVQKESNIDKFMTCLLVSTISSVLVVFFLLIKKLANFSKR